MCTAQPNRSARVCRLGLRRPSLSLLGVCVICLHVVGLGVMVGLQLYFDRWFFSWHNYLRKDAFDVPT